MKALILLFLSLISLSARAELLSGIQVSFRGETKTENADEYSVSLPYGLRGGWYSPEYRVIVAYDQFAEEDESSEVEVVRTHHEVVTFLQYAPFWESGPWMPHVCLGLGGFQERVDTRIGKYRDKSNSKVEAVGYTGIGLLGPVARGPVFMGTDLGLYYAESYDPIYQPSLRFNINVVF